MTALLALAVLIILLVVIGESIRKRADRKVVDDEAPSHPAVPVPPAQSPAPSAPTPPSNAIQAFSPIPLTVLDASPEALSDLQSILTDEERHGRDRRERILTWLLVTNARIQELDDFISVWGPKYASAVRAIAEADPDWESAGELDREDILAGAGQRAIEGFDVRVADLKYDVIARLPAIPATADDALLERYGFETLSFYFRQAGDLERVHVAASDDWYRPRYEALVAKGLAKRGADIEPKAILKTMTLRSMEALAQDIEHKRFTRRAPAIEFLVGLPDLRERLGRQVSFRELFQLQPMPLEFSQIDLTALGHAWAYAAEYAMLLDVTHSTATQARQAMDQAVVDEYAKGWLVEPAFSDTPCCPSCAKQAGKLPKTSKTLPIPHHVGCTCHLSQVYG